MNSIHMTRNAIEIAETDRFDALYELSQSTVMQAVTDCVCGCGYIGSSWTTRDEADAISEQLALQQSSCLLDIGAGAGWPGLYLAGRSGCHVTLVDLPETGIAIARERAETDGLAEQVRAIVGDATELTFAPETFSAINHSDLLCCLLPKRSILEECRRVIQCDGRMVFSVISIAPGLPENDYREAVSNGPPFIECECSYSEMLEDTGWRLHTRLDLTAAYEKSCERMLLADQRYEADLSKLIGQEEFALRQDAWKKKCLLSADALRYDICFWSNHVERQSAWGQNPLISSKTLPK